MSDRLNSLAKSFHGKNFHHKFKQSETSMANLDSPNQKRFPGVAGFRKLLQKIDPQNGWKTKQIVPGFDSRSKN